MYPTDNVSVNSEDSPGESDPISSEPDYFFYRIRFRPDGQESCGFARDREMKPGRTVMVKTDHGLEPAIVRGPSPRRYEGEGDPRGCFEIVRQPSSDEENRFAGLIEKEREAFAICAELIVRHRLVMRLIRVEKFFNGGKYIFYFTAENRVDFRGLVKDLVQEFRTRVEMRQIGVRHETKMVGGMGICGRELCCSSFLTSFDSVSIKMAKEQDLPLNPAKISGTCNRLLCCLVYEYDTYKKQRRTMPRVGQSITIDGASYQVKRQQPLQQVIVAVDGAGEEHHLSRDQWMGAQQNEAARPSRQNDGKQRGGRDKSAPSRSR
jgi:cell fate regulator YaaT (PSP1 superfamily)